MRKYTTDWRGISVIFTALALLNAATFYWNRNPELPLIKVVIGLVAWFAFISLGVLIMTVFSYASISDKTLKYVWLFFFRRTIDINSITEIKDASTYKVAKNQFRSLYVLYEENGETKHIELRITIFPEETLGRLIKDLKAVNPRIKLNKYTERLM